MTDLSDYIRRVHEPEIAALQKRIAAQAVLLKRLLQWDHLDGAADGPYWRREIEKILGLDAADVPAAREGKG